MSKWELSPDRCFCVEPTQRGLARQLYNSVKDLPLVCPHSHVDPSLFSDPKASFISPTALFIIPDHYVRRMLYSQGVKYDSLGVPAFDESKTEDDHRKIWQIFAENFHLFVGTPTGLWLSDELINVFEISEKPNGKNAQKLYDQIQELLNNPNFNPRALLDKFNIETICTTDAAGDELIHHRKLIEQGWEGRIRPTFRPDMVVQLDSPGWNENIQKLSAVSGIYIKDYDSFIDALEQRREVFKSLGGIATDHSAESADTTPLHRRGAQRIFASALRGEVTAEQGKVFTAHMFMELARMSVQDGLVMQMHIGSHRNHNLSVYQRFGPDQGGDIPLRTEWTKSLHPLLNNFGNHPSFRLILFTLDESTYSRELAPLAGFYPALRLGPPWWFFDSVKGMNRYLDSVIESAGVYNTVGFNDDTRSFLSIPARHDVWRRVSCNWLAGQVVTGIIEEEEAYLLAEQFAYRLAKKAYNL